MKEEKYVFMFLLPNRLEVESNDKKLLESFMEGLDPVWIKKADFKQKTIQKRIYIKN